MPLAAVPNQVCPQCRTNPPSDAAAVFADARNGVTIKDVATLRITAIEESDRVMVDAPWPGPPGFRAYKPIEE